MLQQFHKSSHESSNSDYGPRMVFLSSNTACLFLETFLLTRWAADKTFAWENIMIRDRS